MKNPIKKLRDWFNGLIGSQKGLLIAGLYFVGIRSWELIGRSDWFYIPCYGGLFFAVLFTVFYCKHNKE